MEDFKQPSNYSKYSWVSKVAIFAVVLVISGAILTQTHFLEGLLKLLGVGASQVERISISSVDDFRGVSNLGIWADLEGGYNQPVFDNTAPFSYFTGQPADPGVVPGFIMPLVTSVNGILETQASSSYTSPVLKMSADSLGNILQSIEVLDYTPQSSIIYQYRASDTLGELTGESGRSFQVLDMATISTNGKFTQRQAILGIAMPQYIQFKIIFGDFAPSDRPMVAEIDIVHGPKSEVSLQESNLTTPLEFNGDFNGDGVVDSSDYAIFLQKMKADFEKRGQTS